MIPAESDPSHRGCMEAAVCRQLRMQLGAAGCVGGCSRVSPNDMPPWIGSIYLPRPRPAPCAAGAAALPAVRQLPASPALPQVAQPGTPYFYVELDTGEKLFHRIRGRFPLHFGREVLASEALLALPQRADWRRCAAERAEEAAQARAFRRDFQPFDFALRA